MISLKFNMNLAFSDDSYNLLSIIKYVKRLGDFEFIVLLCHIGNGSCLCNILLYLRLFHRSMGQQRA